MIQQLNPNVLALVAMRLAMCLDGRSMSVQALKKTLLPILLLCGESSQFAVVTLVKTAFTKPAHQLACLLEAAGYYNWM